MCIYIEFFIIPAVPKNCLSATRTFSQYRLPSCRVPFSGVLVSGGGGGGTMCDVETGTSFDSRNDAWYKGTFLINNIY